MVNGKWKSKHVPPCPSLMLPFSSSPFNYLSCTTDTIINHLNKSRRPRFPTLTKTSTSSTTAITSAPPPWSWTARPPAACSTSAALGRGRCTRAPRGRDRASSPPRLLLLLVLLLRLLLRVPTDRNTILLPARSGGPCLMCTRAARSRETRGAWQSGVKFVTGFGFDRLGWEVGGST